MKGGIPITAYFEIGASGGLHGGASYSAATRRYTVGATSEWRFGRTFSVEVDAMYHRLGYVGLIDSFNSSNGDFQHSAIDMKGSCWDFPLLATVRFRHAAGLYIAGGETLRYVGPVHGAGTITTAP